MTIFKNTLTEMAETFKYAQIKHPESKHVVKGLVIEFCDILSRQNPQFDRKRFLKATEP